MSLTSYAPEIASVALVAGIYAYVAQTRKRRKKPATDARETVEFKAARAAGDDKFDDAVDLIGSDVVDQVPTEIIPDVPVSGRAGTSDTPESVEARSSRLRDRFAKSQGSIGAGLRSLFSGSALDEDTWQEFEDTLIMADLGVSAASDVVKRLKGAVKAAGTSDAAALKDVARVELTAIVDGGFDRTLKITRHENRPAVVLTVGVNGTGKTTTTGKLARLLTAQDKDVVLGAADTFRAAAAEQLQTWGERVGVPVVRGPEGGDPASVAFEAVQAGIDGEVDVVLIDTAGRLHTKQGLMDELGKVYRVASKAGAIDEVLLVIDATTGQNGLTQAKVFSEVVPVTGVVLTKLDGTAKGGIVVAVQNELGVPVKLVGLGEGPDDLAIFNPADFVSGLLS